MICVLMSDEHRRDRMRIAAGHLEALESFTAGDASIHQNACLRAFNQRAITAAAAGQHRNRNSHAPQHTFTYCGFGSDSLIKRSAWAEFKPKKIIGKGA